MKALVIVLLIALAVVHQDFWWWDDATLVFGFIPIGLAWHAGISLAAGFIGLLAVTFCWPKRLEVADGDPGVGPAAPGAQSEGRPE